MNKPQYLAYGSMRSYSDIQYDLLCETLNKNEIALDRIKCQTLIRLILYHMGPIDNNNRGNLLWRSSWHQGVFDECDFKKLENILEKRIEIIKEIPRDIQSLYILGEITDYLSQWSSYSRKLSRLISGIAFDLANEKEKALLKY